MPEFNGLTRRNTIFPKGEDAVESTDLLRAIYITGTEDIEALPDPHTFQGGVNGFEDRREMRDSQRRPNPRPPR